MFEKIVQLLAEKLGATAGIGTQIACQYGRCSGQVAGHTCSGSRKVEYAQQFLAEH